MKTIIFLGTMLFSSFAMGELPNIITVTGYGTDWGIELPSELAKKEAEGEAMTICQGEIKRLGDWDINVIIRKEGVLTVAATAQFECMHTNSN